ncbi:hypothetical protein BST61_g6383 [Cercospora zeina]
MAPDRPSPYRSRYLLYKKGSQQVVTWLHETASRLGHSQPLEKLRAIDLLSFAQTISNASPKIELPANIASTLSDVIYLRQEAHEWYTSLARNDDGDGNDRIGSINASHKFCIDVLKRVRATLLPVGAENPTSDQQKQEQKLLVSDIPNIFANLNLEEALSAAVALRTQLQTHLLKSLKTSGLLQSGACFKIFSTLGSMYDSYGGDITMARSRDIVFANADTSLRLYVNIMRALDIKIGQNVSGIVEFSSAIDEGANGMEAADLFCASAWRILQDFVTSSQNDCISTAAVVQCQMYMDMYDALGRRTASVTSMLQPAAGSAVESLSVYLRVWEKHPRFQASLQNDSEHITALADISLEDRFTGAEVPDACKPSSVFAALPIFAGTYLYELAGRTSSYATQCANLSFGIMGAAYLYTAAQGMPKWTTMALLLGQHRNFVPRTSSLDKHTRNFEQAVGAKNMTRRRPAGKGLPNALEAAQVSLDLTCHEQAIKMTDQGLQVSGKPGDEYFGIIHEAIRLHKGKRFAAREGAKSAVDLLSAFTEVLIDDEAKASIDYFRLAARCDALLASIIRDFKPSLQKKYFNAASKTSSTILDSLKPYFEHFIGMEAEQKMGLQALGGCMSVQDKPCNRWNWGGDDRPGYINGKKIFGPETPWDCEVRKAIEISAAITQKAVRRWNAERSKGTTGPKLVQKVDEIESWAKEEHLKAGLAIRLKRFEYASGNYIGFERVVCEESAKILCVE